MMSQAITSYIALGSNLNHPVQQIKRTLNELNQIPDSKVSKHSSLYQSKPLGSIDQPDFINAVAELTTALSAELLLEQLQQLEIQHGRIQQQHWGARTLDLDILLYGNHCIHHDRLVIPHPEMHKRDFVLYPLLEINPTLSLPNGDTIISLTKNCPNRLTRHHN